MARSAGMAGADKRHIRSLFHVAENEQGQLQGAMQVLAAMTSI
jgi:hypothetical protein